MMRTGKPPTYDFGTIILAIGIAGIAILVRLLRSGALTLVNGIWHWNGLR